MTVENLAEQLRYSSPDSIYIVTWNNELKKLLTPFKVLVLMSIDEFDAGEIAWVEQVKVTSKLKTVFVINGKAYYYYHFDFIIE